MPVIIEPTENEQLTKITLSGSVPLRELIKSVNAYGKAGPTRLELYDARELEGERFSAGEIDMLVDYFRKYPDRRPPGSKTAIVVSKTVDIGIARMFSILLDGVVSFRIEAFRSVGKALEWLTSAHP